MIFRSTELGLFAAIHDSEATRLTPQPDFPLQDLTESNAEVLTYILNHDRGSDTHARQNYEASQRHLYFQATWALRTLGLRPRYGSEEFRAFTQGFATMEAATSAVKSSDAAKNRVVAAQAYDQRLATRQVHDLLVGHPVQGEGEVVDGVLISTQSIEDIDRAKQVGNPTVQLTFGDHYASWAVERPNTHGLIIETAPRSAPLNEIRARLIGARIAYQLQLPTEAAA